MKRIWIFLLLCLPLHAQYSLPPSTIMKTPFVVGYISFSSTASSVPDLFYRRTGVGTACIGSTNSTCTGINLTVDSVTVPQTSTLGTVTAGATTISGTFKLSNFINTETKCLTLTASQVAQPDIYPCQSINGITQSTVIAPQIGDVPMAVSTTQWQWQTIAKLASASPTVNHAVCVKSTGPPVLYGFCSTAVDATGACTCN